MSLAKTESVAEIKARNKELINEVLEGLSGKDRQAPRQAS